MNTIRSRYRVDAGGEVGAGPPFLVHHADLHRVARQAEHVLDRVEQLAGKGDFLRPVHLGFDDVDRTRAAVAVAAHPLDILRADRAGDDRIHDALRYLGAVLQHDRRISHQVADIADEQQAAAGQAALGAVLPGDGDIARQLARHRRAPLVEALGQIAADQAEPVGVAEPLILGIDGGDRVLEIDDRGQRRLEHDVGEVQPVAFADRVLGIDHQLDMQPVMPEQRAACRSADMRFGIAQRQIVERFEIGPRAFGQRQRLVEEASPLRDHRGAACLVICARPRGRRIERVGAVKRVVEAAPACIRRVQHEARIESGHHQLRPRHRCDLGIDVLGADGKWLGLGDEVADLFQEGAIGVRHRAACRAARGATRRSAPASPRVCPAARGCAGRSERGCRRSPARTHPPRCRAGRRPPLRGRRQGRDRRSGRRGWLSSGHPERRGKRRHGPHVTPSWGETVTRFGEADREDGEAVRNHALP